MMRLYTDFHKESQKALKNGAQLETIRALPVVSSIIRSKYEIPDDDLGKMDELSKSMYSSFKELANKEVTAVVDTK